MTLKGEMYIEHTDTKYDREDLFLPPVIMNAMEELVAALKVDWKGFENLRNEILKKGNFFGNDDEISNDCADRFAKSLNAYFKDKKTSLGYKYLIGNLIGYSKLFGIKS